MAKQFHRVSAFLILAASSLAQTTDVFIPDASSSSGVVGNVIPFSPSFGATPGSMTHLVIIPAARLQLAGVHAGDHLVDIKLAPIGTGVAQAPVFRMIVGHVQDPYSSMGFLDSFLDFDILYDTLMAGPFRWHATADAWSSLGVGGGGFAWDGVHDVGLYTTHAGMTVSSTTGWTGACWRESTLFRKWSSGYETITATNLLQNGLKMGLRFADSATASASVGWYGQGTSGLLGIPQMLIPQAPTFGNPSFSVGLANAWPGSLAMLVVSSRAGNQPIGLYADVRLLVDVSSTATVFIEPRPVSASGSVYLTVPVPSWDPNLLGLPIHAQWIVAGDPGAPATIYGVSLALSSGVTLTPGV